MNVAPFSRIVSFDPNPARSWGIALEVHQLDLGHALAQHRDARLDEALALFGGVILGVLAQVAVLARALDLLGQILRQLALEHRDFVFESFDQTGFHDS